MAEHLISAVRNSVPAVATVSSLDHGTVLAVSAAINMAWCVMLAVLGCVL
jgi:hypothetical protein